MRLAGVKLNATITKQGLVKDNMRLYNVYFTCGIMVALDDDEEYVQPSTNYASGNRERMETVSGVRTERAERVGERNEEVMGNNTCHFQPSSGLAVTTTFGSSSLSFSSVIKVRRLMSGTSTKKSVRIYLADSRGYLHVYKVKN